jgi:hypothetical protein
MSRGVNKAIIVGDEYKMYLSGMSIPDVFIETGIALSTLRSRFKKAGILRDRVSAIRLARARGRFPSTKGSKRIFSFEWCRNISKGKLAVSALTAKGTSLKPNGYIEITTGRNKGRMQHRVVAEMTEGRLLTSNDVVHHKDKDKTNNSPCNLQVMTASEHQRHHALENNETRNRDNLGRYK